jgi:putative MATE family efflux protein
VKDLTTGAIATHMVTMAVPIFGSMITVMLWLLVDMYFVAGVSDAAVAGVGAAGNAGFLINALSQILGAGTMALISHAAGRKDQAGATLVFNQSLGLAAIWGITTLVIGFVLARSYMRWVAADDATIDAGTTYLLWFMPALCLQFMTVVMASALRGIGIVQPTVISQAAAVITNIVLAPVLIAGWGTGHALGVAGAGLASSLAAVINLAILAFYFKVGEHYLSVDWKLWRPQMQQWRRILVIGLPAGAEFAFMFVYMAVIYYALNIFGSAAQAGFGIGSRLLGLIQAPAMAIAFAAGPIVGQNLGAGNNARVKETFRQAVLITTGVMVVFTILVEWRTVSLMVVFTDHASTIGADALFLQLVSLNLVAQGLLFVCSSTFQGLGNTKPLLISSGVRVVTYAVPIIWLSAQPDFRIEHVWYLSIATTTLQAAVSLLLLRVEFRKLFGAFAQ